MAADLISELLGFLDRSPTPYHAQACSSALLEAAGFRQLREEDAWELKLGDRVYLTRADASLAAFIVGSAPPQDAGFRLIGAHTDSPNLRLKPNASGSQHGYQQLGVEVYGGVLLSTWLDRDLSLAGRVVVERDGALHRVLVDVKQPLARIPNLAIHLNRTVNTEGLRLNPQQHMVPIIGLNGDADHHPLDDVLEQALASAGLQAKASDILGFDLSLYDVQPASRSGAKQEFIHSARLDNLLGCFAALKAIATADATAGFTRGIVLYDHEEVGSRSAQGADSTLLEQCLLRLCQRPGTHLPVDSLPRALARSFMVSCDTAHAVHPNYAEMHESKHRPHMGAGPVIKRHAGQSYATDGESTARFMQFCRRADVVPQHFVTRSDLGCGSTIGPITAGRLGLRTVDIGHPLLSMHSVREMAAAADIDSMHRVMAAYFAA